MKQNDLRRSPPERALTDALRLTSVVSLALALSLPFGANAQYTERYYPATLCTADIGWGVGEDIIPGTGELSNRLGNDFRNENFAGIHFGPRDQTLYCPIHLGLAGFNPTDGNTLIFHVLDFAEDPLMQLDQAVEAQVCAASWDGLDFRCSAITRSEGSLVNPADASCCRDPAYDGGPSQLVVDGNLGMGGVGVPAQPWTALYAIVTLPYFRLQQEGVDPETFQLIGYTQVNSPPSPNNGELPLITDPPPEP